ncbi:hypothetical protein STEG23_008392, partial [Scotinomys teguina]
LFISPPPILYDKDSKTQALDYIRLILEKPLHPELRELTHRMITTKLCKTKWSFRFLLHRRNCWTLYRAKRERLLAYKLKNECLNITEELGSTRHNRTFKEEYTHKVLRKGDNTGNPSSPHQNQACPNFSYEKNQQIP